MPWLKRSNLPVSAEQSDWVDQTFVRLAEMLGADRLLDAQVMTPTVDCFPDVYDGSESSLPPMFNQVARAMQINPADVEVSIFREDYELTRAITPLFSGSSPGAGGVYHHDPSSKAQISINAEHLKDPTSLVAVLAHELGHVMLLRPGLVERGCPDMEPMNDLLTVFLGFGIFTANAAFSFRQFTDFQSQGWSARRLGYLPEEMFGYALARFAHEREETKPAWASLLNRNVASYMKHSSQWLVSNHKPRLF
jgi:hypothetical protein